MGESDFLLPLLQEPGKPLDLRVNWKGKIFDVECVLQEWEIAIVLVVKYSDEERRVVKLFPKRKEICLFKRAFRSETHAYRKLLSTSCPVVPRFYGSCLSTSLIYPPDCGIPESRRLCGGQKAIMLEYIDGELVTPDNFTLAIGKKALDGLKLLHDLSILHNDICDWGLVRNVMMSRNGGAKWLDFERSLMGPDLRDGLIDFEWELAVEILGPGGHMYKFSLGETLELGR